MKVHGIKTSSTRRSSRIVPVQTIDGRGKLMQWDCSYSAVDKLSSYTVSSFVSLVTRPGLRGIWVDAPYHCAAGPHQYRRVPVALEIKIRLACIRGLAHQAMGKIEHQVHKYWTRAVTMLTYFSKQSRDERRSRKVSEQAWNDMWREFGEK
jgi:hypothetical protein